jgi:hypothetical protein
MVVAPRGLIGRRMRPAGGRILTAVATTLLLFAGGCQSGRPAGAAPTPAASASAQAGSDQNACATVPVREACSSVTVDGRAQRYQLTRSASTKKTVIVDFGGPGLAVLSGAFGLGGFGAAQPELAGYNLLFVEEPWVTAPLPDGCDEALTGYYRSLRDAPATSDRAAAKLNANCLGPGSHWGFDPATYTRTLRQIAQREGLELTGFVGYSFGDVRFAYAKGLGLRWGVFVRPYSLDVPGREIVAARAVAVAGLVARARKLGSQPDTTSALRSVPVTSFDELSAEVALSYLDETNFHQYGREVADRTNPARIGSLSDDLWRRYDTERISPAYLAYLSEVCRATPDWPTIRSVRNPGDVIAASTGPCAATGAPASAALDLPSSNVCVVTGDNDPVIPARVVKTMIAEHPRWRQVKSGTKDHLSRDGLAECVHQVAK